MLVLLTTTTLVASTEAENVTVAPCGDRSSRWVEHQSHPPLSPLFGLTVLTVGTGAAPAPSNGTITPNQEVLPPVQVVVAVWIPVAVAASASETIPGVTLGATVIPVYPVPGLAVKLQQGTSVTANIRSLALTVAPLVGDSGCSSASWVSCLPKLSTFSKQSAYWRTGRRQRSGLPFSDI